MPFLWENGSALRLSYKNCTSDWKFETKLEPGNVIDQLVFDQDSGNVSFTADGGHVNTIYVNHRPGTDKTNDEVWLTAIGYLNKGFVGAVVEGLPPAPAFIKSGVGNLTLTGNVMQTGETDVNNGTLTYNVPAGRTTTIATNSQINVAPGADAFGGRGD